ncbi:hypothetical protein [Marinospirillum sp.]|uniref:hypothetical protein n=1 Tax=Marinospirillum sp. TaxID=2183934 RepID=UPI003A8B56D8
MESLVLGSWLFYALAGLVLMMASWKFLFWLPLTLKLGMVLSQLVLLVVPAEVIDQAYAPAFIVLVLDGLMGVSDPTRQAEQFLMLGLGLVGAWVLAVLIGWWAKNRTTVPAASGSAETEE